MYRGTPSRRAPQIYPHHSRREAYSHGNLHYRSRDVHSLNGATANSYRNANVNYAGRGVQHGYSRWSGRADQQHTHPQATPADTHQPRRGVTEFSSPSDNAQTWGFPFAVDPVPAPSLVLRLEEEESPAKVPDMKPVDKLPKELVGAFGGKSENWYKHMDSLELDVFQKHAFNAMQCYFAIKASVKGQAKSLIYALETQLETPRWADYIRRGTFLQPRIGWL